MHIPLQREQRNLVTWWFYWDSSFSSSFFFFDLRDVLFTIYVINPRTKRLLASSFNKCVRVIFTFDQSSGVGVYTSAVNVTNSSFLACLVTVSWYPTPSFWSRSIRPHCLFDLLPTNRTHPQSFCTFQTTAYVAAWYEDHVCFSVQTDLQNVICWKRNELFLFLLQFIVIKMAHIVRLSELLVHEINRRLWHYDETALVKNKPCIFVHLWDLATSFSNAVWVLRRFLSVQKVERRLSRTQ